MKAEGLIGWLKQQNKTNLIIIMGVLGMVLIGLSAWISSGSSSDEPTQESWQDSTEGYAVRLEQRLERMIEKMQGAGDCQVMVTVEQGTEYIYATQDKNSTQVDATSQADKQSTESKTSGEQTYIMVSTKQGEQPLLLTELAPRIQGVVAVCDGGADPQVVKRITLALATALSIREDQICVTAKS